MANAYTTTERPTATTAPEPAIGREREMCRSALPDVADQHTFGARVMCSHSERRTAAVSAALFGLPLDRVQHTAEDQPDERREEAPVPLNPTAGFIVRGGSASLIGHENLTR